MAKLKVLEGEEEVVAEVVQMLEGVEFEELSRVVEGIKRLVVQMPDGFELRSLYQAQCSLKKFLHCVLGLNMW